MIDHSFLEKNRSDLIDIYKKERFMNNGGEEGSLILDYRKENNVDVYFWTVSNMIPHIKEIFMTEYKKNMDKKNLVYVILLDNKDIEMKVYQV
jgi:hypothetical protein